MTTKCRFNGFSRGIIKAYLELAIVVEAFSLRWQRAIFFANYIWPFNTTISVHVFFIVFHVFFRLGVFTVFIVMLCINAEQLWWHVRYIVHIKYSVLHHNIVSKSTRWDIMNVYLSAIIEMS